MIEGDLERRHIEEVEDAWFAEKVASPFAESVKLAACHSLAASTSET